MIVSCHRFVVDFVLLESILPSYQVDGLCNHRRRSARQQDGKFRRFGLSTNVFQDKFFPNKSKIPPTISI